MYNRETRFFDAIVTPAESDSALKKSQGITLGAPGLRGLVRCADFFLAWLLGRSAR